jgi:hypothetical protein
VNTLERITLDDGQQILVETTAVFGETDVTSLSIQSDAGQLFRKIGSLANDLRSIFETIQPDEASIEVGVGFAVESGKLTAVLMKGSAEGNIKVSLTWKKPSNET